MLRDRVPKLVNYALKYLKCKEKWLDHVYHNWIWIYSDNEQRNKTTKELLGLDKKGRPTRFNFEGTILWDNLTVEEKEYWKSVTRWVSWFQNQYSYVQNTYDVLTSTGKDIITIKTSIMQDHLKWLCPTTEDDEDTRKEKSTLVNDLTDYLIDCFENRI